MTNQKWLKWLGVASMAATAGLGLGLGYMMAYERWTFFADLWGDFLVLALIFAILAFEYGLFRMATRHDMHYLHLPIAATAVFCLLYFPGKVRVVVGTDLRWEQLRSAIAAPPRERQEPYPPMGR
ncbi:MAG: hypothetical protein RMM53_06220 [Bacteroidia bacterium]|nr:hypothetical protein [Bacteroidia bacterium]MDW8333791.1 hypothetical protein [Bacteroidia bacterium]